MHPAIQWCIEATGLAFAFLHLLGYAARLGKVLKKPMLVLVDVIGRLTVLWLKLLYRIRQRLLR